LALKIYGSAGDCTSFQVSKSGDVPTTIQSWILSDGACGLGLPLGPYSSASRLRSISVSQHVRQLTWITILIGAGIYREANSRDR